MTSGPEPARSPAWSPEGRSIAYLQTLPAQNQAVMAIPAAGGTPRVVTTIRTVVVCIAWTPDSRYLIVPDSGGNHLLALFLIPVATGERRKLTPSDSYFHPALSPDGRTLAFTTDRGPGGREAVCTMSPGPDFVPSGPVGVLDETTGVTARRPTWGADGQSILFARTERAILRVPASGGPVRVLSDPGSNVVFAHEISRGQLVLVRQRRFSFLAKVSGGNPGAASSATPIFALPQKDFALPQKDFDGALSPDESIIVFRSGRSPGPRRREGRRIRRNSHRSPAGMVPGKPTWSPDGRYIYFEGVADKTSRRRSGIFRTAVAHLSQGIAAEALQLDGVDDSNPRISPDGRRIYFTSNRSGSFHVWSTPVAGGPIQAISPPDEASFRPVAEESFDGIDVYYTSTKGICRLSRRTGERNLHMAVEALEIHLKNNQLCYSTAQSTAAGQVLCRPLAPRSPLLAYFLGPYGARTQLPSEDGLLATMVRNESNLDLLTER